MLGKMLANLGPLPYSQQPLRVDIPSGINIHEVRLRLTGEVTVVGSNDDGTLVAEGVQGLLRSARIRHDGDDRVNRIGGRALFGLTRRSQLDVAAPEELADADTQADSPISCDFIIPIAQPWLAQPALTCWPGSMPVRQELALYIEWETSTGGNGAGSDPGTGALITGSTDVVTFSVAPQLEVILVYSTGSISPWYLTRITAQQTTEQFSAANARLPYLLNGNKRITAILHRALDAGVAADLINTITLQASGGSIEFWDNVPFDVLRSLDLGNFPASFDGPDGELFTLFTDNGLLSTNLDPRIYSQPRVLYDTAAPSGAAVVDLTVIELDTLAGVTQMRS
jgi:hypothetical protein